jgi:formamidopyrimidine-DNA glycosylase
VAERPDLEYALPILAVELAGARVARVEVDRPVVVRVATGRADERFEPPQIGGVFGAVERRAHVALFALDAPDDGGGARPLEIGVQPMLAGRFRLDAPGAKRPRDAAVTWVLEDGRALVYRDDVQMGKVFLLDRGRRDRMPGLDRVGLDALDPAVFTREAFRALARKRRDQAKVFVMDKGAIDALGNAYGDEVLFEAGIHPKAWVAKLPDDQVDALHDAIVRVLGRARDVLRERRPPLDEKLRDFLSVRGRAGEPCVRCGAKLRRAGVHGHDAIFCPVCQPDERGSAIVDWRKLAEARSQGPFTPEAPSPPAQGAATTPSPAKKPRRKRGTTSG